MRLMESMLNLQVYRGGKISQCLEYLFQQLRLILRLSSNEYNNYLSRGSILSSVSSVLRSTSSGDGGYGAYGQAPPIIQVLDFLPELFILG